MDRKKLMALLLSLVLSLGLAGGANAANRTAADFPDYDSRAWYAEAMAAAVEDGLLRGTDKGLLNPQGNLTRAEMAAIIPAAPAPTTITLSLLTVVPFLSRACLITSRHTPPSHTPDTRPRCSPAAQRWR